ncbi:hypothetical protein [Halorhodospira halophila]|uniref:hypothetical protein n=1 Tax=Halorhodospira halophila TaxID=1053 RepID=UPI001907CF29|nr:hypothetical protein [Halorhodospira halophila]
MHDATAAEFPLQLEWRKAEETRLRRTVNWVLARFLRYRSPPENTWLPVPEKEFVQLTQRMHDRLFVMPSGTSASFTLLNQSGSGWNPVASTDFFSHRKVVLVTRDPRDQFAELKTFKRARNVDEFVKWYRAMQQRIEIEHPDLHIVRFEDFVLDHHDAKSSLCVFSGIEADVPSSYSTEMSTLNISKYRQTLSSEEIEKLETELGQHIRERVQ